MPIIILYGPGRTNGYEIQLYEMFSCRNGGAGNRRWSSGNLL